MIVAKNLCKNFGTTKAVDHVSFSVNAGEIVGFLGPNGAGKSTTMKLLTCYLAPDFGSASIGGHDVINDPVSARKMIGYLPETTPLYDDLGVIDSLRYVAELNQISSADQNGRISYVIDVCDLAPMAHKDVSELSKGYRQRLGLAQALIADPPVLILDEPTSGLDPNQTVGIRQMIKDISQHKAIIFSTHILSEAEATCSRILVINNGKLVHEGTAETLSAAATRESIYRIRVKGNIAGLKSAWHQISDVSNVKEGTLHDGWQEFTIKSKSTSDLSETLFESVCQNSSKLNMLVKDEINIEEAFRQLTQGGI